MLVKNLPEVKEIMNELIGVFSVDIGIGQIQKDISTFKPDMAHIIQLISRLIPYKDNIRRTSNK